MIKRTRLRVVDFFINPKILFASLAGAMFQFNLACLEPNFVFKLINEKLTVIQIGLLYGVTPTAFILTSIFLRQIRKTFDRKIIIIGGSIINALGSILIGPSYIFKIPVKVWIIIVGCAV